jgi:hypothetical protein
MDTEGAHHEAKHELMSGIRDTMTLMDRQFASSLFSTATLAWPTCNYAL